MDTSKTALKRERHVYLLNANLCPTGTKKSINHGKLKHAQFNCHSFIAVRDKKSEHQKTGKKSNGSRWPPACKNGKMSVCLLELWTSHQDRDSSRTRRIKTQTPKVHLLQAKRGQMEMTQKYQIKLDNKHLCKDKKIWFTFPKISRTLSTDPRLPYIQHN